MPFVPTAHDELTTVEKTSTTKLWRWVGFMPYEYLERVIDGIEHLMPLTNQVVTREGKDSPRGFEDALELNCPLFRVKRNHIPCSDIVVETAAPGHVDIPGRV